MRHGNGTADLVALTSMRSALSFAMECLERCSERHDDLERAIEDALKLSARKELECTVIRDLSRHRDRLGIADM